ncbi:MAG: SPOR domain-containing protein [Candidatus Saccharicenans sp.]|jgi:cell division septation protein DedD|nr:SPOR domain-containing protein [Candidatus Saccharicenans sp.]MDH7574330.1 SPOR domain-containing protein [Candidatus Saccharicenans sp.]
MVRNYREIQVSSTILVFIILGIIVLGAVIFFIGVQVGKKQADLMVKTMTAQKAEETVSAPVPVPAAEESSGTAASQATSTAAPVQSPAQPETKPAEMPAGQTASKTTQQTASPPARTSEQSAATTPRTSPGTRTTVPATGGNFFIQVGAFNDRPSARLEAEKYKKQGYNAVVQEPFARDRKPLYRVWLGGYRTREEAQKALSELVSKTARNPGFFIVQQ